MRVEREPWRPDWRDASAYSWLDSATGPQLAWEFLRRNAQYKSDFLALQAMKEERLSGLLNGGYEGSSINIEAKEAALCQRYGVAPLSSPDTPASEVRFSLCPPCFAIGWEAEGLFPDAVELDSENEVLVKFTLGTTLDLQIKEAKAFLKTLNTDASTRNRTKRYAPCLRALDGVAEGVNPYEIGRALMPDCIPSSFSAEANSLIEQGQALAAHKYLSLVFSEPAKAQRRGQKKR